MRIRTYLLCAVLLYSLANEAIAKKLRTNGYSIFWSDTISGGTSSVSGWFALESLPTDTAAFIGVKDADGRYINICTDHWGHLLLGCNGRYEKLNSTVEPFEWVHLILDMKDKRIFKNGRSLSHRSWSSLNTSSPLLLWAGKDFTERQGWGYDLNIINGVIDGIRADTVSIEKVMLLANIGQRLKLHPDLSIDTKNFRYEFSRPKYHLIPAANWTNESHGLIYYNGLYHIFNQKNASNILLREINWGHFSSPDLIHWTEERPALHPSEPYDSLGIWSGHAVINKEGVPEIIYTGGARHTSINIAFPVDSSLISWRKYPCNPVIPDRPKQFLRTDMRDPYVFFDNDQYYMIVGFGIDRPQGSHGALLLYKSCDLKKWNYVGLLFEGNPSKDHSGRFWEMPVFKKMGKKWILSVNRVPEPGIPARTQYWIGSFNKERFVPDNPIPQNLEVINRLLSPSVSDTPSGKTVAIAIIPDEITGRGNYENGWAHLFSIPRQWVFNGKKICQVPYEGLGKLRTNHRSFDETILDRPLILSKAGLQKEILLTYRGKGDKPFGVTLYKSPDGSEYTKLYFNPVSEEIIIDQSHSSKRKNIPSNIRRDHYHVDTKKPVKLHLFIDGSVVEGFINDEDAFTTRVFPSSEDSAEIEVFSEDKSMTVQADIYDMKAAPIRLNF